MAFLYLAEEDVAPPVVGSSTKKQSYTWAIAVSVVSLLLVAVVIGITLVAIKISRLKKKRQNRATEVPMTGPESIPMPVNEDEGIVRLDATVTNTEI